jgi:hypothetical protein
MRIRNLAVLLLLLPSTALATSYDEGVNGDLSGNMAAPTSLVLTPGSNPVAGSTIAGDLDYLTISIPAALREIVLTQYDNLTTVSFIAVQSGTTFTEPPGTPNVANLLGWLHFGGGFVGTDVQDDIGNGVGAIGFDGPLPAGDYTFWIQETAPYTATYAFDFVVVPEPGSAALALLGLAAVALRRSAS